MTPHRKQVAILKETYRAKQNTTPTGFRRLMSLILCLCLFLSILPSGLMTTALAASGTDTAPDSGAAVTVTHKGSAVDSLSLPQDERTTLTAVCASDVTDASYQWQILADVASELWVNIYDATEQSLALSCALLNSLADDTGSAYVRCRVTASGQTIDSNVVCVTAARTIPVETGAEDEADANAAPTGRVPALRAPARAPAATSEEYVEITINYLDAVTRKSIYKSYQAQIEKGTGYTSTVISPAYLGYAPFYNAAAPSGTDTSAANDDATTIHLNIPTSYSAPTYVVNVYYKAIDVPYAVRYYFQNIHDDTYSENVGLYRVSAAKTGTIISDDTLKLLAGEAEGFTKLYHYPEAVAADGSTVFQCYYDRNYYMLKFDMDGGYGTEPVYARYGTAFIVTAPTRHGYVFAGWDDVTGGTGDGDPDTLPTTIPAENRTYKALWRTVNTTYTTVYWLQNADDDQYSFIGSVKGNAPSGTTVSGGDTLTAKTPLCGNTEHTHNPSDCYPQNFNQLVYNDEKTQKNVTIKGDGSTTVNVYYDRKAYTLRFFYARKNSDGQFQLVGGTTYPFGNKTHDRPTSYNVDNLLDAVTDWGNITGVPNLKDEYNGKYTKGTRDSNGYTYYYLDLNARFDADLSTLWPGDCFERVPVQGTHTTNGADQYMGSGQWGNYAYLAGWNGEFKVKYTLDHDNSTIKGMFQRLDENLLYGPGEVSENSSNEINFLGYFCNGADVDWSKPWQWLYELYVPVLDGETPNLTTHDGKSYKLFKTIDTADNNREISHQTQPTLHGFTTDGQQQQNNPVMSDGRESYTARFFYKREAYTLTLHNYNEAVPTVTLPYQTPLAPHVPQDPAYPSKLEAGAYTFGGWYYSSGCYDGTEYHQGDTMPAGNITLYAKWTPVTRTVRFFQTYDAMLAYEKTGNEAGLIKTYNVAHGTRVGSVDDPKDKSEHNYVFSGWFYMLAGKKTAYAPQDIPVTRDLNVFADWGSHTAQPYLVHYALHTGEKDPEWTAALKTASGQATPDNNQTFTVSVGSETRTYVYLTSDGHFHRQIAADSTGYAYQGNTRTFYPKVGDPLNELYADFNTGCYPTLASHSITVESESDKTAPVENVFTFTYAHAKRISYTVEYRYADNNELISSAPDNGSVEKFSDRAVVTERFAVIQDYIPDAFYKRLILAVKVDADGKVTSQDNVVVFYYTKNETHAPYAVHHMLQTLDAALNDQSGLETDANGNYQNYAEDEARIQGIGKTDSTLHVTPQTFSGFTVGNTGIQITTKITTAGTTTTKKEITRSGAYFPITIDRNGTDLYVFYTRSDQDYRVYYLKYGTSTKDLSKLVYNPNDSAHASGVLAAVKPDSGKFGQTVTENAKDIAGWSCVSDKQQTLLLRSDAKQNNIFFFYQPVQYSVDYQVWPQGGGTVSPSKEVVEGDTLFKGSTPTEKPGYRFEGWYLDENCTTPVTAAEGTVNSTTNRLVPNKSKLEAMPKGNTFYAKFLPVLGNLTITRSHASNEGKGDRVFVYRIKAAEDPSFELFVSIKGNGSVTIKDLFCFTYTIEQQNRWSWRYADTSQTVKVTKDGNAEVTFADAPAKNKWLNGNSDREVNRKR